MSKENKRTIVLEDGQTIVLNLPNVGQGSQADLEYAKGYTKALKDGLLPRVVIERTLVDSGAWGSDKEVESQALHSELEKVVLASREERDPDKKAEYKVKFNEIRGKMSAIAYEREQLAAASAEARGEEARYGYLTWNCVTNEDGSRLWENADAFYSETDTILVRTALQELVAFMSGLSEKVKELDRILEGDVEETEEEVEEEEIKAEEKTEEKEEASIEEVVSEQPKAEKEAPAEEKELASKE